MLQDGQNTSGVINVPTDNESASTKQDKRASTKGSASTKPEVLRLKALQDRIWAISGLKMAVDKLRDLKYDVVLAQDESGACTIKITLGVKFDMDTGLIEGKDIWAVENALEEQIKALETK